MPADIFFSVVLYGMEISSRSCECIFTLIGFARTVVVVHFG
jgi:hypothetical protein